MQKLPEILKIAEAEAAPMGLTVVETRFSQQGKRRTLEVTICRKGGRVSLDDCEELSRRLDQTLEELTPPLIEGSYMLEVQSPGLERQLKSEREFEIFSGEQVEVKTKEAVSALGDTFTGMLQSLSGGVLTIREPQPVKQPVLSRKKANKTSSETAAQIPELISLEWSKVLRVRLHALDPDKSDTAPNYN